MQFDKDSITLVTAITGAAFGLLGAVLGIMNTWRAFDRDRPRLLVTPIMLISETEEWLGIKVTNLGYQPVTLKNVGFTLRWSSDHMPVLFHLFGGGRLPQRMEPRTSITAMVPQATRHHPNFARVSRAYADTDCGRRFTGSSGALRHQIRKSATAPT